MVLAFNGVELVSLKVGKKTVGRLQKVPKQT